MNNRPDSSVIVVGAGLAGLMAAYAAAQRGKHVTVLAAGAGTLSINGGCIDLLGYTRCASTGKSKPVSGLAMLQLSRLPHSHPYQLVGVKAVEEALEALVRLSASQGLDMIPPDGSQSNHRLPTIMGTLKPTYLCAASANPFALHKARRVLIAGIGGDGSTGGGIRDCHPGLIAQQLQRYRAFADISFLTAMLPSPLGKTHRSLNALDVARHVDSDQGFDWCASQLKSLSREADVILIPPICGVMPHVGQDSVWQRLQKESGATLIEMISLPPGVGGLRLRTVFHNALRDLGVRVQENTSIVRAEVEDGTCAALISRAEDGERRHEADSFIIATGGILGGGVLTSPGKASESIFGLHIDAPEDPTDWSESELFGAHAFASMGIRANSRLCPVDANDKELLHNVHFAGRSLGGYDHVFEKSGNGVALSTGWHAAQMV